MKVNENTISLLRQGIGYVREEFNNRIDGLARKVVNKVCASLNKVETNIENKVAACNRERKKEQLRSRTV